MWFMHQYGMSIVLHYSKKQKHLEQTGQHWKREWAYFEDRSKSVPETNSQDSEDHRVRPKDENIHRYTKQHH